MPINYAIDASAYATIVLHATKHVSATSGILLGDFHSDTITIYQALPVAHSDLAISTSPLAESAFLLAEQLAKTAEQRIVGVYFANETSNDPTIPTVPTRMADLVARHFSNACLCMVDAARLAPDVRTKEHCLRICTKDRLAAGSWARAARPSSHLAVEIPALVLTDRMLDGQLQGLELFQLADFEDHCLDPTLDWINYRLCATMKKHMLGVRA